MLDLGNPHELRGRKMVDRDGDKIGTVEDVFLDDQTDAPEFALVNTGMFGSKSSFVPLRGASADGDDVRVPVEKAQVKDAPGLDAGEDISPEDEHRLYAHYGYDDPDASSGAGAGERDLGAEQSGPAAEQQSTERFDAPPHTDEPPTREEGGQPATEGASGAAPGAAPAGDAQQGGQERGLPRLRRHIVTEEVQITVPVQREEIRIEEPDEGRLDADEASRESTPRVDDSRTPPDEGGAPGEERRP
jgi:sporulation protein YlmC with PRC-barrel domain